MAKEQHKTAEPGSEEATTQADEQNPQTDRVAMVSRRADGTPDQSAGFVVIGEDGK